MKVKIKNILLGQSIELLFNLPLKGTQSRHRTKFIKQIDEKLKEVAEQEQELLKEHCYLDENGEPKKVKGGKGYDVKDMKAFATDRNELYNEETVIDGGDNQVTIKTLQKALFNCEEEFSGEQASIYDYLCDQFNVDDLMDD